MTREELYKSERGERAYYQSKRSLKERIKLPLTQDGCEALLEIVTEALDLPLDDTMRQVFAGYIHHTNQLENSTSLGDIGKVLFNHLAKSATWIMDQESKERINEEKKKKEEAQKLKLAENTPSEPAQPQDAAQ